MCLLAWATTYISLSVRVTGSVEIYIILIAKTLITLGEKTKVYVVYPFNMDLGGILDELI
jgi:hypothetical protein